MRPIGPDDPNMPLSEVFAEWPDSVGVFLEARMLCPGCPIAPFHAITDACLEYDLDEDAFRLSLASALEARGAAAAR